jgi:hypothetical protein
LSRIVPLLVRRREAVSPIAKITVRILIEMHQGRAAAIDGKGRCNLPVCLLIETT